MSLYDIWDAQKQRPPTAAPTERPVHNGHARPYTARALELEVENVATAVEGTRNHTLNTAAFNLGGLIAAGGLDEHTVREHLTAAANTCGLDPAEIRNTITSGLNAGMKEPRTIPDPATTPVGTVTVLGEPIAEIVTVDLADKVRERLPLIDWHELWTRETRDDWIVEPILPARRLVALYSPPKVGKSLLMLELAVAISRGTPVLGTKIDRPRRVLYVDFENDPEGDVRERLKAMQVTPGDLDGLCYLSFPTLAHLDTEVGALELLAAVDVYECEVVVIDTVSRSVGGDENENDTWLNFYRHTGMKLKKAEKALIRLDHTGKDETKGQRGGSAKVGDVDAVWKLSKVNDTTFRLDCEAHRFPLTEKTLVLHRRDNPLHHTVDATGARAAWDAKVEDCQRALDDAGAPGDISNRGAADLLRSVGNSARTEVIAEVLRRRKQRLGAFPAGRETQDEIAAIDTSPERLGNGERR